MQIRSHEEADKKYDERNGNISPNGYFRNEAFDLEGSRATMFSQVLKTYGGLRGHGGFHQLLRESVHGTDMEAAKRV